MLLLNHVKLNRIMLKKRDIKEKVNFIKNVKYAYNIISLF